MINMSNLKSLSTLGVRRRFIAAMLLIIFLPLAVFLHFIGHTYISIAALICLAVLVACGWWLMFDLVRAIERMQAQSRQALAHFAGSGERTITAGSGEVAQLEESMRALSSKVKDSLQELKAMGDRTQELNSQIDHKVSVLSAILQANVLFSKGRPVSEIIEFLLSRIAVIVCASSAVVVVYDSDQDAVDIFDSGLDEESQEALRRDPQFKELSQLKEIMILDAADTRLSGVRRDLGLSAAAIFPLCSRNECIGHLIIGDRRKDYVFDPDNLDTADFFSRNISVVLEYEHMNSRIQDLEITDAGTGFYNARFFKSRLDEEIKRSQAYQRPCGLLVVRLANYQDYRARFSEAELGILMGKLAAAIKETVRPQDIIGRLAQDSVGIMALEMNRRQTAYAGARLREKLESFLNRESGLAPKLQIAAVESPIDGISADVLLAAAGVKIG